MTRDQKITIAIGFDKIQKGFNAALVFEVTAINLGFSKFGEVGSKVKYNPLFHEDTVSGMLPGDNAVIITQGWIYDSECYVRAKVKPI